MYLVGNGVALDGRKAVEWFRRSAEAGDPNGLANLALSYAQGLGGLPQDKILAYVLWRRTEAAGNRDAGFNLAGLRRALTPQQQAEAEALFAQWPPGAPLPARASSLKP